MMEQVIEAGEALARGASKRLIARTAQAARRVLPDAVVTIEPSGVAIEARGLEARREAEPALRWIGGELR